MNNNFSELLNFAIDLAKSAGKIHMKYFEKLLSVESKSSNIDLVSKADIESNKYIMDEIQFAYPNHSILSEEMDEYSGESDYQWIIDPLDGTTNFVHNLPIFSCSIGLKKNNKT